jgi:hypothetical protein
MKEKDLWWKRLEYVKYDIDESEDYWLPPEEFDPEKLKPRRLDPNEYDMMHTALTTINNWTEKVGSDKLRQIIGAVNIIMTTGTEKSSGSQLIDFAPEFRVKPVEVPPSLYRALADHWACYECNDRGDKWYMQFHHCSKSESKSKLESEFKSKSKKGESNT